MNSSLCKVDFRSIFESSAFRTFLFGIQGVIEGGKLRAVLETVDEYVDDAAFVEVPGVPVHGGPHRQVGGQEHHVHHALHQLARLQLQHPAFKGSDFFHWKERIGWGPQGADPPFLYTRVGR